jgi:hypothetical protein
LNSNVFKVFSVNLPILSFQNYDLQWGHLVDFFKLSVIQVSQMRTSHFRHYCGFQTTR